MLKFIIRSPHLLEVLVAYGGVHIFSIYHLISFGGGLYDYLFGLFIGGILYTFIEYWFHRVFLHWMPDAMKKAHDNHHKNPTKLKIICTPLIPVQLYETITMITISYFFSPYIAVLLQTGISISQITMDFVHLFEHSRWRPLFLKSARSYHMLHHKPTNHHMGFGLTSCFWDYVFNTLPDPVTIEKKGGKIIPWEPFEKYPILRFFQIPLPLLSFIIYTPFLKNKLINSKGNISKLNMPKLEDIKWKKVFIGLLSGIWVSFTPFILSYIF